MSWSIFRYVVGDILSAYFLFWAFNIKLRRIVLVHHQFNILLDLTFLILLASLKLMIQLGIEIVVCMKSISTIWMTLGVLIQKLPLRLFFLILSLVFISQFHVRNNLGAILVLTGRYLKLFCGKYFIAFSSETIFFVS